MPEFTTVSLTEATLQTSSGRQKRYLHEYIDYITQLPKGQAGRLKIGAEEKPATIRRRLGVAAKTLGIPLIIKRSGSAVYFWREDGEEEQPRPRRGRRPRTERPSSLIPPDMLIPEPAEDRGSLLPPTTVSSVPEAGEQGTAER